MRQYCDVTAHTRGRCQRKGQKTLDAVALATSSYLAFKGNVVHLLLSYGANADAQDDRGQTPFQIALLSGRSEIIELMSNYQVRGE